jgi:hypothetical protein
MKHLPKTLSRFRGAPLDEEMRNNLSRLTSDGRTRIRSERRHILFIGFVSAALAGGVAVAVVLFAGPITNYQKGSEEHAASTIAFARLFTQFEQGKGITP